MGRWGKCPVAPSQCCQDPFSTRGPFRRSRTRAHIFAAARLASHGDPDRWGLPDALEPGRSADVVGYIRLATARRTAYWGGLVEKGVRWWQDRVAETVVRAQDLPHKLFLPGLFK